MLLKKESFLLILLILSIVQISFSQTLNAGFPFLEEADRRSSLLGEFSNNAFFQMRPRRLFDKDSNENISITERFFLNERESIGNLPKVRFSILPLVSVSEVNSKRPYGWGNKGLIPNVGFQTYLSTGFFAKLHFLEIQIQPEYVYAQNLAFNGFGNNYSRSAIYSRFFYWNNGDNPERFGDKSWSRIWWGQSSALIVAGPVSFGISSESLWWGPGQFNSLIFSPNSESFPYLTIKTNKPIKTFLGRFEGQILSGRLENSMLPPTQEDLLNENFFIPFDGDWRYLNALHISYNPSFLPNIFIGFNRTFQQYSKYLGDSFRDYFPVFEVFQKKSFFQDGNSLVYDNNGYDQQVSLSFRYLVPKAKMEIYGEMGRRDHSYNWREFILNPEHARAFMFGFQKLIRLNSKDEFIQVRGEVTHQQESVNRYIRYAGLTGNQTWHTHGKARGFTNKGESLGVGIGQGSNVQIMEISHVKGLNKRGVLIERLANNQDYFYRAFGQNPEKNPWIDLSIGLLWNQQWDRLVLGGKIQFIKANNYQWISNSNSTSDFPSGEKLFSIYSQVNLIYQIHKR